MAINRLKIQERAEKLVGQGKIGAAIDQYKVLLKDQPNDLATLNRVGDLLAKLRKPAEAVHLFSRAAQLYTSGGFYPKAIAIYKKILKLDPGATEPRIRLADLYARGDLTSQARVEYLAVLERFAADGFEEKARQVHEKLVRMEPGSLITRTSLGDAYLSKGDAARAVCELQRCAADLEKLGMSDAAVEVHRRILDLEPPQIDIAVESIRGALRLHAFDLAVAAAMALHGRFRDDPAATETLVEALELNGREDEAEELAKTALGDEAEGAIARTVLGRMHARAGRTYRAIDLLLSAGRALCAEGRAEEAARAFDALLELDPSNVTALEQRIEVARALGAREDVASLTERLRTAGGSPGALPGGGWAAGADPSAGGGARAPAAKNPSREEIDFLRERLTEAEVFFKYGLFHKAVDPLREVLSIYPDHVDAHVRLKTVYAEMGDRIRAVEACLVLAVFYEQAGRREEAMAVMLEARELDPENDTVLRALESAGVLEVAPAGAHVARRSAAPENGIPAGESGNPGTAAMEGEPIGHEFFDLEGEFGDSLADVLASDAPDAPPPAEEQDISDVVRTFRQKVDETVDSEDFKTHYDLAIAYKEMGLLDEAVSEFEYAAKDPSRLVECYTMLALCCRERSRADLAVSWYHKALDSVAADGAEAIGLRFDLGETYLEMGEIEKAGEMFREVAAEDESYRGVALRLKEVESAVR